MFPDHHMKRMFPTKVFGTITEDDHSRNQTYGIMTREEGLRLTNEMHRMTLPSERSVPYMELAYKDNKEVKHEWLKEEQSFVAIQ